MDDNNKISGAKLAVQTMLYYYLSSLIDTVEDPKQVIATELGEMINLSEAQIQYVNMNLINDNKMLDNLTCSIDLLKSMEQKKKFDLESIKIIRNILEIMRSQCSAALADHCEFVEDDN